MADICRYCFKEITKGPIVRSGNNLAAHWECHLAVQPSGICPQCKSDTGVKMPRNDSIYCEDCGWPDDDFGKEDETEKCPACGEIATQKGVVSECKTCGNSWLNGA